MDRIVTHYWAKPVPDRRFDWIASYENDEPNDDGQMVTGSGRTEAQAVLDLLDNHYRGVECERDRHCFSCTHFGEQSRPQHDDPYFTISWCSRWWRTTYAEATCSEHYFAGGEPQHEPAPIVEEVAF